MERILNFIDGEFVPARGGRTLPKEDPSRGLVYAELPDSGPADAEDAVRAATRAFPAWSSTPVEERARILNRLADLIERDTEKLARAEARDSGKTLSRARAVEIPRAAANFRFFAAAIVSFHGESYHTDQRALNYTEHSPLGAVLCISPWNLPLYLLTWKLAPALAVGNTVVAKPSEVTPMTAFLLGELAREAGLSPGVLNIVHGTGAGVGGALTGHADIKAISFTGSTVTGRRIAESTAGQFKKLSLEMGGKNANVVFADADFETALNTTVRSTFENQGQICLCGSRIFVERPIYEKFRDALTARARALRLGDPLEDGTEQGPLVSREHWEKVRACLEIARAEKASVLCGGDAAILPGPLKNGYFMQPTLLEGLSPDSRTNQEEIFGPVATIAPFDREDEVIAWANSTRYGLAATVWTRDLPRAHRVARRLHSGLVWVNTWMLRDLRTPFGGVKESGVGREGGLDALKFFTETKNICLSLENLP